LRHAVPMTCVLIPVIFIRLPVTSWENKPKSFDFMDQ
jgi:hypothetical protein